MPDIFTQLRDQSTEPTINQRITWIKYPYGIRIDADPKSVLHSILEVDKFIMGGDADKKTLQEYGNMLTSGVGTEEGGLGSQFDQFNTTPDQDIVQYFTQPTLADTRVGCNDAINPYWQFNRDDDICPPGLVPKSMTLDKNFSTSDTRVRSEIVHSVGMGRVYASMYNDQQQILWIEAGVPRFTNLMSYYRDAANANVAETINSGNLTSLATKAATAVLKGAMWVFFFPVMSLIYIPRWMETLSNERITKYYTFKSTMTMYYSMVNTMLQYTAVSMGLHPYSLRKHDSDDDEDISNGDDIIHTLDLTQGDYETQKVMKRVKVYDDEDDDVPAWARNRNSPWDRKKRSFHYEEREVEVSVPKDKTYDEYYKGVPEILKEGPDIFKIMNRRSRMIDMERAKYTTTELYELAEQQNSDVFIPDAGDPEYGEGNFWEHRKDTISSWWSALKGSVLGSGNHVGFKIERGASFNEDFSNTTGETGLAEKFNSMAEKYKEENELFGNSALGRILTKTATTSMDSGLNNIKQNLAESVKSELQKTTVSIISSAASFDIGTVLVTGNGFLEIPKVWKSSSMTRNYSFSFKLRSRYGDPVSVFQSIYIPLFLLIALAAPRATGDSTYTSPFLIRAYCKGMFNIPLGIITNLSITRGSPEFGWSSQFYPLEVSVTISIEDLSPQLFVSMCDGVLDTFSRNISMQNYLDTLSSLGLREMIYMWPKLVRKMDTALAVARSTIFHSTYHGTKLGKSTLGKVVSALVPFSSDRASLR